MHFAIPKFWVRVLLFSALAIGSMATLSSCKDEYYYDDREPDNLGSSIYDYLKEQGNFSVMLQLIDDMGYAEVLSKTGSKTLFPADDEAFSRFFQSNPYGARSYDDLSVAQKRIIINSSMIDMAYLSDMLPNIATNNSTTYESSGNGLALRRFTSSTYLDTIQAVAADQMPATRFWERFNEKQLFLAPGAPMMVHFTEQMMNVQGITNSDFQTIYGLGYTSGDIYINGVKVRQSDIICKNGYIHVLEDVALPSGSMADVIARDPDTKVFNSLLDKFCAPYFDAGIDADVREYYDGSTPLRPVINGLTSNDSIFVKRYFNEVNANTGPGNEDLSSYGMLYYDPSQMDYSRSSSQQDMGAMFVPTDEAMMEYFNGNEGGYLRDSYGTWDNVPTDVAALFVKNHQKRSFIVSLPHLWPTLTDETSYPIDIDPSNIVKTIPTANGVVYVINKVLPPIDYKGVYGSTLTFDNTTIMKWAITDDWNNLGDAQAMRFYMYLRSMENMYNLLVPTDEALQNYRDPITWALGGSAREIWSFKYEKARNRVTADVYACDEFGVKGDLKRTETNIDIIRNRLIDILDMHIVVGMNEDGQMSGFIDESNARYFLTKGGATITGSGRGASLTMNGGGDIEIGAAPAKVVKSDIGTDCVYDSQNGRTFFIDHILHDPVKNVYNVLSEHPEFSRFFELCLGNDQVATYFSKDVDFQEIFSTKISSTTNSSAIGQVVNSFNNYRYTVFVPTNEAIDAAFAADPELFTWEDIAMDSNEVTKKKKALYLLKFLRYHFVDNSAYINGASYGPIVYETGARNQYDKFHRVTLQSSGADLMVTDEAGHTANVIATEGVYNLMARDLIVNNSDNTKADKITASSRAVIHLIDSTLNYK